MNPTILLIGTGAVADLIYLPLLSSNPGWKKQVRCIDRNLPQMQATATRYGVMSAGTDFRPLLKDAAVAIVATPPHTHHAIAKECLVAGLHVIMEKPLTHTYPEAMELVDIARRAGKLLMVNNTRRLFQSYQEIRRLLATQELGEVREIDYTEGAPFAWPTTSGFYFDAKNGARGVISDRGSHVLDLFCWWLGDRPELTECFVDSDVGVEGYCDVRLRFGAVAARMRLSWHNKLTNRVVIRCEHGTINTGIYDFRAVTVTRHGKSETRQIRAQERAFEDYGISFARQALNSALNDGSPPVLGSDVLSSLHLIDECYQRAQRINFEWLYRFSRNN